MDMRNFQLDTENKVIFGVCSGIAIQKGKPVNNVRFFYILMAFVYGIGIYMYLFRYLKAKGILNSPIQQVDQVNKNINKTVDRANNFVKDIISEKNSVSTQNISDENNEENPSFTNNRKELQKVMKKKKGKNYCDICEKKIGLLKSGINPILSEAIESKLFIPKELTYNGDKIDLADYNNWGKDAWKVLKSEVKNICDKCIKTIEIECPECNSIWTPDNSLSISDNPISSCPTCNIKTWEISQTVFISENKQLFISPSGQGYPNGTELCKIANWKIEQLNNLMTFNLNLVGSFTEGIHMTMLVFEVSQAGNNLITFNFEKGINILFSKNDSTLIKPDFCKKNNLHKYNFPAFITMVGSSISDELFDKLYYAIGKITFRFYSNEKGIFQDIYVNSQEIRSQLYAWKLHILIGPRVTEKNMNQIREKQKSYQKANEFDKNGRTSLINAIINEEEIEVIKELIDNGAMIDQESLYDVDQQWKPLHFAAIKARPDIVKLLINSGAFIDPGISKDRKITPLYMLCQKSELNCASPISIIGDSNNLTNDRYTETMKILIDNGANVNLDSPYMRYSMLTEAIDNGHSKEAISYLISSGVDIEISNYYSKIVKERTPIASAIRENRFDCVKLLCDKGVDISTGFFFAGRANTEILEYLIDKVIDVNSYNEIVKYPKPERTAIYYAIKDYVPSKRALLNRKEQSPEQIVKAEETVLNLKNNIELLVNSGITIKSPGVEAALNSWTFDEMEEIKSEIYSLF